MLGRPGKRSFLPPAEEEPCPVQRPFTPVYPRAATSESVTETAAPETAAQRLGRSLKRLLGDGRFHDGGSLASELGGIHTLAMAVSDLIARDYAFDRLVDHEGEIHLRMRRRSDGESDTLAVAVLDGLTIKKVQLPAETQVDDFDPAADGEVVGSEGVEGLETVEESTTIGLVLSDPPSDLVVPYDYVPGMSNTILARKGSGKTYLAGVLVEELVAAPSGPAVVVVDPLGVWWGLGAKADGAPADRPFLVLGGPRGHVPVKPGDGARVATVVSDCRSTPTVLDLSLLSPSEQYVFVADFVEALWARPSFPIHLVVDEADEFCPQRFGALSAEQRRSRDAVERVVMRGRSRGYGATLVSLRPAVLSKNALSQTGCLWLLCLAAPQDVAAVAGWMEPATQDLSEDRLSTCLGQLPVLPRGTAFMVRGGDEPALRKFKVRRKRTFDSSRTDAATMTFDAELAIPGTDVMAKVRSILVAS